MNKQIEMINGLKTLIEIHTWNWNNSQNEQLTKLSPDQQYLVL